jgi:hypothetical protein
MSVKLEFFNGYEWIFDRHITWDTYQRILRNSPKNTEGTEWRVVL